MSVNGKFAGLTDYFRKLRIPEITLNFKQIEQVIGTKLSDSAYIYPAYWSPSKTHTITKCWIDNGYIISKLDLKEQQVTFRKVELKKSKLVTRNTQNPINIKEPKMVREPTINIEQVLLNIEKYYAELGINPRYLSWEHCYRVFQEARKEEILSDSLVDYLSLHLAFYLASWGMLRGSSFLLQKDYRVHIDIIKELYKPCYSNLWGINHRDLQKEQNLDLLINLVENLKDIYKLKRQNVKEVATDISDILVTKVIMGTIGCVPAYDSYFKVGISKYNIATQLLGKSSIKELAEYYEANETKLEDVRRRISQSSLLDYPQMKILDMAFWQIGIDNK